MVRDNRKAPKGCAPKHTQPKAYAPKYALSRTHTVVGLNTANEKSWGQGAGISGRTAHRSYKVHIETCQRNALVDYLEAPFHFPPAVTPTPTLLLEHCTPLMHALDQCRRDVCPTLKQRHLLTHWGARLSTYIRGCHKIYENASNATLRLYTQATHIIRARTHTIPL